MTEQLVDMDDVTENDIVFDCPECGKSLAIDQRGAGLVISCSDCKAKITVPVPDGMEIDADDVDEDMAESDEEEMSLEYETQITDVSELTEEEKDARIIELEQSLAVSQAKVQELVESLKEVYNRRNYLEQIRVENLERSEKMSRELALIQDALDRIVSAAQDAEVVAAKPTILPLTGP